MQTAIVLNKNPQPEANYISWAPVDCEVKLSDPTGAAGPVTVRLQNSAPGPVGQVVFYANRSGVGQDTLTVTLPVDGSPVPFFLGGKFGAASKKDKDAAIDVVNVASGSVLSTTQLMVRVRKNANTLSTDERDRFITALAQLNNRGMGPFRDFRDMHTSIALPEAHGNAGFLPWHRAYLLDLERALQAIDRSVALPFWRFDQPAPQIFAPDFLGAANQNGTVQFSTTNPLQFWKTDQTPGINRLPLFNTATHAGNALYTETQTLRLGTIFRNFRTMEGNPHGSAHMSFDGYISDPATAPKDPLFFLLHANVDRLWAKWQWVNKLFDGSVPSGYQYTGSAGTPGATRIGHNLNDTLWPWNGSTTPPRPNTSPGGGMASSATTNAPGRSPAIRDMIDFQGRLLANRRLAFDYEDVPFEF